MCKLLSVVLLMLVGFSGVAFADDQAESLWQRLRGDWRGEGTFQGMPSTVRAAFSSELGGQFEHLSIEVSFVPPKGNAQQFAGKAYYSVGKRAAQSHWLDSQGNSYKLNPTLSDELLTVLWGESAMRGKSEYRLLPDAALQVDDYIMNKAGDWQLFATAKLKK